MGCVTPIIVVSILPHAEFGWNSHREDEPHFNDRSQPREPQFPRAKHPYFSVIVGWRFLCWFSPAPTNLSDSVRWQFFEGLCWPSVLKWLKKFNRYELKRYILFHSEYLRSFCRVLIRPFRKKWSNQINFKKYTAWNIWPDIFGILRSFCCSLFSYHIQMVYTDDTRNLWLSRRWPI